MSINNFLSCRISIDDLNKIAEERDIYSLNAEVIHYASITETGAFITSDNNKMQVHHAIFLQNTVIWFIKVNDEYCDLYFCKFFINEIKAMMLLIYQNRSSLDSLSDKDLNRITLFLKSKNLL